MGRDHSCGLSIVETEQAAEALTPLHVGVRAYRRWRSLQELVVESLVAGVGRSTGERMLHHNGNR